MNKVYKFVFSAKADEDFSGLTLLIQKRIVAKLEYFSKSENPLYFAKKLVGAQNKFRFRVGDYRIIVGKIDEDHFVVLLVLKIAHRREVYE